MNNVAQLEQQVLNLPLHERERLALAVWESLEGDPDFDPEGIALARERDKEIEDGQVQPIDHAEFMRRTQSRE